MSWERVAEIDHVPSGFESRSNVWRQYGSEFVQTFRFAWYVEHLQDFSRFYPIDVAVDIELAVEQASKDVIVPPLLGEQLPEQPLF